MQSKDIKVGELYAYTTSVTYGTPSKVKVISKGKYSADRWAAKDRPGRVGNTNFFPNERHGKPMIVVEGHRRAYNEKVELFVVRARDIQRTWADELAARKANDDAKHRADLKKRAHNEVTAKRLAQLQDVLDHYGFDEDVLRTGKARYTGHDVVEINLDDEQLAKLISQITGVPHELEQYPKDEA